MKWYRIISLVTDPIYIFTPHFGWLRLSSLVQKRMLPPHQIFHTSNSFVSEFFVSPALHTLSAESWRHDVHVLFDDVSYDVRSAHWRVNNKIKKIYSSTVIILKFFTSCNENIHIFTRASHSWKYLCFHYTRWKCWWYSQQKSKYPLVILILPIELCKPA